jgi:hypothetical protein
MLSAGVATSAMAQAAGGGAFPQIQAKRQQQIGADLDLSYHTNVAHSNEATSAARGITPEDEIARPKLNFDIVLPVARNAAFLNGTAGYDFHRINKQLDRIDADIKGGVLLNTGPCHTTIFGGYVAAQSDPEDVPGGRARNLLTDVTSAAGATCGSARGFTGTLDARRDDTKNSADVRTSADHTGKTLSGKFGYSNTSLGALMLTGGYSRQRYPNRLTANGQFGDGYTSENLGVSYTKSFGSRLKADILLGGMQLKRESAPPGVPLKTQGFNYSGGVEYKLGNKLRFNLSGERAFQPSNRPGRLYDLVTSTELTALYTMSSRFSVGLGASLVSSVANVDSTIAAKLPTSSQKRVRYGTFTYRPSGKLSLSLDLREEDKTTDLPQFDYTDKSASLKLGVTF